MNSKTWDRFVVGLFQQRGGTRRPVADRRRLTFEYLEDRVVPAQFIWDGSAGDGLWNNGQNWNTGTVPGNGDDLVFGTLAAVGNRNTLDNIPLAANQSFR